MPDPIRLVYLLESLKRGGVQIGALLQAPLLDSRKYQVEIWPLRINGSHGELADEFCQKGLVVKHIPVNGFQDREGILHLARQLANEKVCLLNTKSFYANIVGRIAAILAGTPAVVANYHSTYEHRWKRKYVVYERMLAHRTDAFICVSNGVKEYLQPLLGLPEGRMHVLHNGFDVERYRVRRDKAELRESLDLPSDRPIVAVVARLTAVKDIPTFLRSIPMILRRYPESFFLIVGDGEDRDKLESLAEELGISAIARFAGLRSDVPEILRAADCLVVPSLVEGFGRAIVEAFASETPVVATPTTGAREIIRHGENGLIVPFSDPKAMAQAIIQTLEKPKDTKKRCEQALSDVEQYDLPVWVQKTEYVFDQAIQEKSQSIERFLNAPPSSLLTMALRHARFRFAFRFRTLQDSM